MEQLQYEKEVEKRRMNVEVVQVGGIVPRNSGKFEENREKVHIFSDFSENFSFFSMRIPEITL